MDALDDVYLLLTNLAGLIFSNVLREGDDGQTGRAFANFAESVLTFAMEDEPTLALGFQNLRSLKNAIHATQTLEAIPPWVTDAKQACQRLEMLLDKSGRDKLKALANEAHGVSGALDWIQSEKLVMTPGLQQCVDVLKQAKLLKDTGAEFTVPVKEDLKGTCVCVKNMLTICSLQIEDIKFFFPDAAEHVATFQSTVEAHMEERFVMIERWVRAGKEMITKFRLEW